MTEMEELLKTEQGISSLLAEGALKHSGSLSGFIHVVTQLVKNSEGDGSIILTDVDEALARILGELVNASNGIKSTPPILFSRAPKTPEQQILEMAEQIADPNFYLAEIAGVINALIELKSICHRRAVDS